MPRDNVALKEGLEEIPWGKSSRDDSLRLEEAMLRLGSTRKSRRLEWIMLFEEEYARDEAVSRVFFRWTHRFLPFRTRVPSRVYFQRAHLDGHDDEQSIITIESIIIVITTIRWRERTAGVWQQLAFLSTSSASSSTFAVPSTFVFRTKVGRSFGVSSILCESLHDREREDP